MASQIQHIARAYCVEMAQLSKTEFGEEYGIRDKGAEEGYTLFGVDGCSDIDVFFRRQDLSASNTPPRVVFVPLGGAIITPDQIGRQTDPATGRAVRCVRRRLLAVQVFCWGASLEQTEDLFTNSLLALESFHNAVQFSAESWESQQEGRGGQSSLGQSVSFIAEVDLAVLTKPQRIVRITGLNLKVQELDREEVIIK